MMNDIRKLTTPYIAGSSLKGTFRKALLRGLSASVDAFEAPVYSGPGTAISGIQSDIEVLRADVGRAKIKITREINAKHAEAY